MSLAADSQLPGKHGRKGHAKPLDGANAELMIWCWNNIYLFTPPLHFLLSGIMFTAKLPYYEKNSRIPAGDYRLIQRL